MLKKILDNIQAILVIAAVLVLLLFLNQCNTTRKLKKEMQRQEQISKQNMAALSDSLKVYKNNAGQISYSKPIAQMSPEEIKKYFPELYTSLEAALGKVQVIWKTHIEYRDTGSVKNAIVQLDSNKYSLNYDYYSPDSSLHVKSTNTFFAEAKLVDKEKNQYKVITAPGISTINDLTLKMGFTTGISKEGDLYKIFITPDNKKVTVGDIVGADVSNMINPPQPPSKNKRWSIGPYIGFGMSFGKGTYQIGPGVGVSLQYSVLKF